MLYEFLYFNIYKHGNDLGLCETLRLSR